MRNIISIIVSIASIGVFIFIIQPEYNKVQEMQKMESELDRVLDNARKLQALRDTLLEKRKDIKNSDIIRLTKLIPESADNVKLILEFEQIAERNNLKLEAASASKEEDDSGDDSQSFDIDSKDYGIITLDFSVSGAYADFIDFLESIEKNLRITDIRSLSISPPQGDDIDESDYQYEISIDTYWLKDNI
jgi:Tfp pilus assembly protein PilO